eukprot:2599086-Rhodomonas_salina.1
MSRQQQAGLWRFVDEIERQPDGADPMLTESRFGRTMTPFLNGMSKVFTTTLNGGTAGLAPYETNAGRVVKAVNKFGGSNIAPHVAAGAAVIAAAGASGGVPAYTLAVGPASGFVSAVLLGGALEQISDTTMSRIRTSRGNRVHPSNTEEPLSALVSPRPKSQNISQSGRRERGHRGASSTQRRRSENT